MGDYHLSKQVLRLAIFPHLIISQNLYLEPVLGTPLYEDIVSRYDNQQLTGDTQTLYEEYIIPSLAYSAWYSSSPFINYKTQRSGISTRGTDVDNPVTPEEFAIYNERVKNFMTFYLNRLEDYLIANKTLFPLYRQNNVNQSSGGQIFLGWKNNKRTNPYWDSTGTSYTDGGTDDNC